MRRDVCYIFDAGVQAVYEAYLKAAQQWTCALSLRRQAAPGASGMQRI